MKPVFLSIIIPAYNEAKRIGSTLRSIDEYLRDKEYTYEIIVVSDGSSDDTETVVSGLASEVRNLVLLCNRVNSGKGYAVKCGMLKATGEYRLFLDADHSTHISNLESFLPEIQGSDASVIVGSIALQTSKSIDRAGWYRKILRPISKKIIHSFLRVGVKDTQRGFKLFTKRAAEIIFPKSDSKGFLFDVELLVIATHNNMVVKELPVDWDNPAGSKIKLSSYIKAFVDFLKIVGKKISGKYRSASHFLIQHFDEETESIKGKGFFYKNKEFVHHSNLHHTQTALYNLLSSQKIFIVLLVGILAIGFIIDWHATLVAIIATLTIVYFLDLLFNAFLIYRSFAKNPEIAVSGQELSALSDAALPTYTIFCPLYKEWQVVPQFVSAMQALDYPVEKLQVMFLLEENDVETIEKIREYDLPEHFEIVVVPHSKPKTKPKAMNYGLKHARGEYLVIYDAEDVPEPDQLKKAVRAFEKVKENVVCIQAKLNFYNPHQNVLTRAFTAEYSLWFDLVLPGLQSLNAPIPLGGTSNHFKVSALRELSGWDAFNVTEDADLGMRLAKRGYRTAILDSTTHEEANSGLWNWFNQRSRWIKGYIQTYFVHTRDHEKFLEKGKLKDAIIFHLNIGGKILSMFINPFMWLLTASYFLFRETAGPFIETLFPTTVLYLGVFSLVFGNFLYMYYYMIGCMKRGYTGLVKYAFVIPFYWLGMSAAAWRALYEVVVNPHYWSKTVHGLHLQKEKGEPEILEDIETNAEQIPQYFWTRVRQSIFSGAGVLVVATIIANVFNLLFNIYLGNRLSLEEFGVITALNTLVYLISIVVSAYGTTIVHQVAHLVGRMSQFAGFSYFKKIRAYGFLIAIAAAALWLFLTPAIANYLHISNSLLVASFAPAIIAVLLASVNRGYLHGSLFFKSIAIIVLVEVIAKLGLAIWFVESKIQWFAALSLPISMIIAYLISLFMVKRPEKVPLDRSTQKDFSFSFFGAALVTGFSTMAFLSLDVFFAKHYLSPSEAGVYSLLSLVGKMIFFFGSLLNAFIVPMTSRLEGKGEDAKPLFYKIFLGAFFCSLVSSAGLVLTGPYVLPLMFGAKAATIFAYIPLYALAMFLLAVTNTVVLFHLARKQYLFAAISIFSALLMVFGISRANDSVEKIVGVFLFSNAIYAILIFSSHLFYGKIVSFYKNVLDALRVFLPIPAALPAKPGKKRILIFNWRCLNHTFAGGAEVYIQTFAKQWVKEGHSVTIFCGNDRQSLSNEFVDGIRVIRRGGFYSVYINAFLYYMAKFRGKFDVIIDCENGIPFFTPLYAKESVYILVHHVHQEVFRKTLVAPLAAFAAFMERKVMPAVYRNTPFITVSESSKADLEALGVTSRNIEVIHPGADIAFLRPAPKNDVPTISYVGRLKDYKSIDVLIKAFAKVVRKVPRAQLVIAGTGEMRGTLESVAKELGIEGSVNFVGRVSEEVKREIYQQSWVTVNPSMMEGWGITTIEANACGTPVVAADVPGLRDSVRDGITGFLFPHGDDEVLAEKLVKIIKSKVLQRKLAMNAIEWSQDFAWEKGADKFLRIIV